MCKWKGQSSVKVVVLKVDSTEPAASRALVSVMQNKDWSINPDSEEGEESMFAASVSHGSNYQVACLAVISGIEPRICSSPTSIMW